MKNEQKVKTQDKGGRPIKGSSQKKGYRVNVKMATEEYYTLKAKAREAGMTISECIRMNIMNAVIQQRLTPEIHDHIRKLCGMANNLNQIAHKANAQGYLNARIEYLHLADRIDNLLNELRNDR